MKCLVTGATGYIGGRLAPRLLAEGHTVCLAGRAGRPRAGRALGGGGMARTIARGAKRATARVPAA